MTETYRRLIAAYDGSDLAREGLALAQRLARGTGAELLLAYVFPSVFPYGPWSQAYEASLREQSHVEEMLAAVQRELQPQIVVDTRVLGSSSVAHGLHDLGEAEEADLIVLGSSHRGPVGRVLAGSVAERLLHGAPCAVAVAPRGYSEPDAWRSIVAAFDGSPESKLALAHAADLADATGAALRVIAVLEPVTYPASSRIPEVIDTGEIARAHREYLERELEQAVEALAPDVRAERRLIGGDPVEVLSKEAETAVDLLVIGSRGYGPLGRVLLGSVSTRLVRSAPCPVVVIPRETGGPDPAGRSLLTSSGDAT